MRLAHKMLGWSNSSSLHADKAGACSIQEDGQFHHSNLVPRQEGFLVFISAARRKWIFLSGKKCSSNNNNRGNWGTRASRQEAKLSPGTPLLVTVVVFWIRMPPSTGSYIWILRVFYFFEVFHRRCVLMFQKPMSAFVSLPVDQDVALSCYSSTCLQATILPTMMIID